MSQFKFTPSFLALLKDQIEGSAQATVRDLCEAHVGRKTQRRIHQETR